MDCDIKAAASKSPRMIEPLGRSCSPRGAFHFVSTAPPIERLLIYRFGQIGDTVAALPALWHLRSQFPDAEFTLLSETPGRGGQLPPNLVLPSQGLVQRYLKYQGGKSITGLLSQAMTVIRLRAMRFDAMVYLLPSIRTAAQRRRDEGFFKWAGISRRMGFLGFPDDPLPRNEDGSLKTVPHEADALLHRLTLDGLPTVVPGKGRMDLDLIAEERQVAKDWLTRHGVSAGKWFALCHGSKWSSKCWPTERYVEVVRSLSCTWPQRSAPAAWASSHPSIGRAAGAPMAQGTKFSDSPSPARAVFPPSARFRTSASPASKPTRRFKPAADC